MLVYVEQVKDLKGVDNLSLLLASMTVFCFVLLC